MNAAGDKVAIGATGNDGNGNPQDMLEFMPGTGPLGHNKGKTLMEKLEVIILVVLFL